MPQQNEKQKSSDVRNPCFGAAVFGLGGAASVAIGADIMGHSVHKEAMTMLVGGVITGALAGTLGCCLPNTQDANLGMKIAFGVLETGLCLAASLTAPLMGERILNLGTIWGETVVDKLVGVSVLTAGCLGLAATAVAGAGVLGCYNGTLFAQRNTTGNNTATSLSAAVENEAATAANRV